MDENLHNPIDDKFRNVLQTYRDENKSSVWDRIEKKLDEDKQLSSGINRRKVILLATAIVLLLSGASTWYLLTGHSNIFSIESKLKSKNIGINSVDIATEKTTGENRNAKNSQSPLNSNSKISWSGVRGSEIYNNHPGSTTNPVCSSEIFSDPENAKQLNNFRNKNIPLFTSLQTFEKLLTFNDHFTFSPPVAITDKTIVKPEIKRPVSRFSLTPYFSQEFAGYNLSDDDATAADGREIEERERNVFSASVGVYLNYRLSKRLMIQSGISYSWSSSIIDSAKSFAVQDNTGNVQFKLNTISGYSYIKTSSPQQPNIGDSILTAKAYSQLHYITIPVILSYKIPLHRFSLLLGGGVNMNFLTSANVKTKIYGPNVLENISSVPVNGLKNINYGIIIKAELEYLMNYTWGFNIIPSFKNSVSPINIHSALSAYPYNFGIGAGLTYHFR
jgi:hypothetical protein